MKEKISPREINQKWKIEKRKCFSNDIKKFYKLIINQARLKGFNVKTLGKVDNKPIFLLYPKKIIKSNKNVLIAAGFHGDEPAGNWGLLDFLEKYNNSNKINLSFLPLVNPTGFKKGLLRNIFGENPNRGYVQKDFSREGVILFRNIKFLKKLSRDGYLSLHEEYELKKFYVYTFERKKKPGAFSIQMLNSANDFYKKWGNGTINDANAKNGIIFNEHDGSFEDYLFLSGTKKCVTSETPRGSGIDKRIKANKVITQKFIDLILQGK
jgi:hypothetical protein